MLKNHNFSEKHSFSDYYNFEEFVKSLSGAYTIFLPLAISDINGNPIYLPLGLDACSGLFGEARSFGYLHTPPCDGCRSHCECDPIDHHQLILLID